jgi:lysophospholipase L1-like esterase
VIFNSFLDAGDSLTEGFTLGGMVFHPYTKVLNRLLTSAFPQSRVQITNAGISGELTGQMLFRLQKMVKVEKRQFTHMILLGGSNDLYHHFDSKKILDNIAAMHKLADEHGIKTFLVTVPEIALDGSLGDIDPSIKERWLTVNKSIRELYPNNHIDLATLLPYFAASQEDRDKYWDDGVHFTKEGYDHIGQLFFDSIKSKL